MAYLCELPELDGSESPQKVGAVCLEAQVLHHQVAAGALSEALHEGGLAASSLANLAVTIQRGTVGKSKRRGQNRVRGLVTRLRKRGVGDGELNGCNALRHADEKNTVCTEKRVSSPPPTETVSNHQ